MQTSFHYTVLPVIATILTNYVYKYLQLVGASVPQPPIFVALFPPRFLATALLPLQQLLYELPLKMVCEIQFWTYKYKHHFITPFYQSYLLFLLITSTNTFSLQALLFLSRQSLSLFFLLDFSQPPCFLCSSFYTSILWKWFVKFILRSLHRTTLSVIATILTNHVYKYLQLAGASVPQPPIFVALFPPRFLANALLPLQQLLNELPLKMVSQIQFWECKCVEPVIIVDLGAWRIFILITSTNTFSL